jgi:hypothetical protein
MFVRPSTEVDHRHREKHLKVRQDLLARREGGEVLCIFQFRKKRDRTVVNQILENAGF